MTKLYGTRSATSPQSDLFTGVLGHHRTATDLLCCDIKVLVRCPVSCGFSSTPSPQHIRAFLSSPPPPHASVGHSQHTFQLLLRSVPRCSCPTDGRVGPSSCSLQLRFRPKRTKDKHACCHCELTKSCKTVPIPHKTTHLGKKGFYRLKNEHIFSGICAFIHCVSMETLKMRSFRNTWGCLSEEAMATAALVPLCPVYSSMTPHHYLIGRLCSSSRLVWDRRIFIRRHSNEVHRPCGSSFGVV